MQFLEGGGGIFPKCPILDPPLSRDLFFFFFGLSIASTSCLFTTHCNTTIKVQKSQDFFTFQVGRPDNGIFRGVFLPASSFC